jgi:hypothetical protein
MNVQYCLLYCKVLRIALTVMNNGTETMHKILKADISKLPVQATSLLNRTWFEFFS